MEITREDLQQIIKEELDAVLNERCQKGYKTHPTRKTKKMFGRTYRNCVKAEEGLNAEVSEFKEKELTDPCEMAKDPTRRPMGMSKKKAEELCKKQSQKNTMDEKKKKAGTESSKESSLRDWFGRKGAKGKKGGWVDCNAPDGKGGYKSCGRSSGEKRSKYPSCRPTPGACKEKGKGKSWGKKAAKGKKG